MKQKWVRFVKLSPGPGNKKLSGALETMAPALTRTLALDHSQGGAKQQGNVFSQ